MSKVSLTAASFVQQRILHADTTRPDIIVNACCPGNFIFKKYFNLSIFNEIIRLCGN